MRTPKGRIRLRLNHGGSPNASRWLSSVAAASTHCRGCRFYRAEPVPRGWARDWYYGPPYALLQGTLLATAANGVLARPALQREAGCVLQRGMLIMIDKGPDFLIGLAAHPEWATSYTHVADVVSEDMRIVDDVMAEPLVTQNWGSINAT
eukprot:7386303-Prymnesium_polylepis.1